MCAVRLAELERVTAFAKAVAAPLAEAWSRRAGATVRIESPQAAELGADDLAASLEGWFWVLPVEVTGVYGGAFSLLIEQSLLASGGAPGAADERSAGQFAAVVDEFLAAAADRLTAAVGSAVTLDRLGLREVPGRQAAEILMEFLGRGEFVAVNFAAEIAATHASESARSGGVTVVFGAGLASEIGGSHLAGADTVAPAAPPKGAAPAGPPPTRRMPAPGRAAPRGGEIDALLARAGKLKLTLSAEIGRRTVPLGDLLRLGRGAVFDLGKSVTAPLEMRLGGRLVAEGDAVVLPGGYGLRIRG